MTNRYLYITLLAILGFSANASAQSSLQSKGAPRLVVNIAIDQLRTDYLEAFAPLYCDRGLKLLLGQGMVFANASYPFAPVDRASAIAAIASGTTPYYNSIVGNRWLNRETLRPVGCVDDAKYSGMLTSETASPLGLQVSTLADELKVATGGKALVYAVAPFREAAVLAAGHAADAALWIDNIFGTWCSSTYYLRDMPAWLSSFNAEKAPGKHIDNVTWQPLTQQTATFNYYLQTSVGDKPFKHKFKGSSRFADYKQSALVNQDVTDMAMRCITNTGMGRDGVTDLLSLTYYAGTYGPQSMTDCQMELQDTYLRLDIELSRLLKYISQNLSIEEVLFVVTSTGYSDVEPSDYARFRIPTGTLYMSRTANLMNMYLGAIWGQDNYVETIFRNQIFLNHKLLETKKISMGEATSRAQEIVAMMTGVKNVYTSLQLLTSQSAQTEKTRNGFNPQRCGDIIIEAAPGWRVLNEDTQESEMAVASYTQFPIIIFGAGTQAERISTPVSTDRIAPTIARAIRIRAPNACSAEPLF
ncbi:MAG: alkaline phosphatase family protein [Prevotella sp.]|nr:alkaline phosphatase family protein [Prevotella sp.]